MNDKIMQSIHHEHAENIFIGAKDYEIRKTAPSGGSYPYIIYMYETKRDGGAGAVVGFYMCRAIITTNAFGEALYKSNTPEEAAVRQEIAKRACRTEEQLIEYADSGSIRIWVVSNPIRFPRPRPLSDFGLSRAPQSWQYLK